jgi:long-chain acyl-CoA synthetase
VLCNTLSALSSFQELAAVKYNALTLRLSKVDKLGFGNLALSDPGALALIDPNGVNWSRQKLFDLSNRISRALLATGLSNGDTVAILMPNCAEYLAVYLAGIQIGLYVVPINHHLSADEISHILEDSESRAIFTHARIGKSQLENLQRTSGDSKTLVSVGSVSSIRSLDQFIEGFSPAVLTDTATGHVLLYTSATTGRPKGVLLPLSDADAALQRTMQFHRTFSIDPDAHHVHLCASMLYHSGPLEGAIIGLHIGHVVVLVNIADPESILKIIETYGVTTGYVVPTTLVRLLKLPTEVREKYSVSTLRRIIHSGAPCPPEVKRQMIDWWGPVLWEGYGATEGAGTVVSSEDWLKYPGTVGKPIPGSQIKILDDAGAELPAGEVGAIYLTRYNGGKFEYKGDQEKTHAAYSGEFFKVGDVGYLNSEGYLFICDREIDMIISGGVNIYSAEIERALVIHPKVTDCAVFGAPDELWGETVHAVVQTAPGVEQGQQLTRELLAFLGQHVSQVKLPRRIEYAEQLPRDPNGKLYKRKLRETALSTKFTK